MKLTDNKTNFIAILIVLVIIANTTMVFIGKATLEEAAQYGAFITAILTAIGFKFSKPESNTKHEE